jgi:hypothetical protein
VAEWIADEKRSADEKGTTKKLTMMQATGRAASNHLTFICSMEGVAAMGTAGVCIDSWLRNECRRSSHGFHISKDLLFFSHCKKNIPQLMQ